MSRSKVIVAIVGFLILGIVSWPYLAGSRGVSRESPKVRRLVTMGNLNTLRSALDAYKGKFGTFPKDLAELQAKGVLTESVLAAELPVVSSKVFYGASLEVEGSGGWFYVNDPRSNDFGKLVVNSGEKDVVNGRPWSSF